MWAEALVAPRSVGALAQQLARRMHQVDLIRVRVKG